MFLPILIRRQQRQCYLIVKSFLDDLYQIATYSAADNTTIIKKKLSLFSDNQSDFNQKNNK